jgi:hypothetical protein
MNMSNGKITTHTSVSDGNELVYKVAVPLSLSSMNKKCVPLPSNLLTLHQRQGVEFIYPRNPVYPSRTIPFYFKKSTKQPIDEERFILDCNLGREGHLPKETLDAILGGKKTTNDASDLGGGRGGKRCARESCTVYRLKMPLRTRRAVVLGPTRLMGSSTFHAEGFATKEWF